MNGAGCLSETEPTGTTSSKVLAKQQEPLCWHCFHNSLTKTVRKAIRQKSLVQPCDRVLVAVSGGFASTALLRLLKEMCNMNLDRDQQGQIAFRMGVIHVDEGAAQGGTPEECRRATEAISLLHQANMPDLPLHCVQLEDVFEGETGSSAMAVDKRTLLINLLQAVEDVTGREDLIESLRNALLVRMAAKLGYNKVARGDCATRVAVRTIASAAKGAGFALPASIQHFDARGGEGQPAVICPVRDLPIKDLAMLCHWLHAAPMQPPRLQRRARGKASLNALAEHFVAGLQSTLPSTVPTILRTALKLQAFSWNHAGTTLGRAQDQNGVVSPASTPHPLCTICRAPLSHTDLAAHKKQHATIGSQEAVLPSSSRPEHMSADVREEGQNASTSHQRFENGCSNSGVHAMIMNHKLAQ
ncbi:Cytoplasmic tRNA 2-thiolation protein 2 [Coccomyxa sp. Obi]|nr:Cytoplasmic tRNA 2-thiolation protein 2 [Coccomyxa sp. Obi]